MPYKKKKDLPKSVRNNLPSHALTIFLKAFNNAWDEYSDPKNRKKSSSREETAMKVAWTAVKNKYRKDKEGNWIKK